MVLRKSRCLGKGAPLNGAPAKIIFCVESEKNMEYNPINALKMKSFSGYTPKKTLSLGCDKCLLPVPLYSSNSGEKFCDSWVQTRGYEACVFCMPIPLRVC